APLAWSWPGYWWELLYYYYWHALFAAFLLLFNRYGRVEVRAIIGRTPVAPEYVSGLKLTVFLFVFSVAAAFALFYPLSFVAPGFVKWWYLEYPALVYFDHEGLLFIPNLFGLVSLCVLAPLLEEYAFRGLLLMRWADKWGLKAGVFGSSFVFAIVHPDPIGAFAFGVGMSYLYLKYQSLLLPVACHAFHNLIVWLIEAGYVLAGQRDFAYTIEEYQQEWRLGVVAIVITAVWAITFIQKNKIRVPWSQDVA
ncbi:MAG: CPBP family intramembrane metalloprotease, partial [Xanthomonadales bacterium]|nr:CPBP family intramembrane metalloprotease [Xanthomonadales bacterium]